MLTKQVKENNKQDVSEAFCLRFADDAMIIVGGERSPAGSGRLDNEYLRPEDILIRDFTDAVRTGDLSLFFALHPEVARFALRQAEAERIRNYRRQMSPEEAAERRQRDAEQARMRRQQRSPEEVLAQRQRLSSEEAAERREKDAARKRVARAKAKALGGPDS